MEKLLKDLEAKITETYTEGVTMEQAEKLAGEFLVAQMKVSAALAKMDLDARMRKTGVKAVRGALYSELKNGGEKLTEGGVAAALDSDKIIQQEQDDFDRAEVQRDELKRYYDVFQNAHVHFRTIAKGSFGG